MLVWLDIDRQVVVKRGLTEAAITELHREVARLSRAEQAGAVQAPAGWTVVDGAEFPYVSGITLGRAIWGSRRGVRHEPIGRAITAAQMLDAGAAGPTHPDFSVENLIVGRRGSVTLIDWKEEVAADGSPIALASLLGSAIAYRSTDVAGRFDRLLGACPELAPALSGVLAERIRDRETIPLRGVSGTARHALADVIETQVSVVAR